MNDDDSAACRVPVKAEDSFGVKVEVSREPEDDGMEEMEGEVGGKRRKMGRGMQGKEMSFDAFAPMVEEKEVVEEDAMVVVGAMEENGGIDIPFGDPRCLKRDFFLSPPRGLLRRYQEIGKDHNNNSIRTRR